MSVYVDLEDVKCGLTVSCIPIQSTIMACGDWLLNKLNIQNSHKLGCQCDVQCA